MRIIDTSALMEDPQVACPRHDGELVVIPSMCVRELDHLKDNPHKSSRARAAIGCILGLLRSQKIQVDSGWSNEPDADDQILKLAEEYFWDADRQIVSNDLAIHVRAISDDIQCVECSQSFPDIDEMFLTGEDIGVLCSSGKCEVPGPRRTPNECLLLRNSNCPSQTVLGIVGGPYIYRVPKKKPWDVYPKTMRQHFLANILMDPEIQIATVVGGAGTGKTYLSVAAALDQVFNVNAHQWVYVTRPFIPVGRDIGWLPGGEDEKMEPWHGPVDMILKEMIDQGSKHLFRYIRRFPLTFARGATVKDAYWIIDEAQNFSMEELKVLLSRVGENTKVILTGDISQTDRRVSSGGLHAVSRAYLGEKFYAHITLDRVHRGDVCRVACEKL